MQRYIVMNNDDCLVTWKQKAPSWSTLARGGAWRSPGGSGNVNGGLP